MNTDNELGILDHDLGRLRAGSHHDPHSILGAHEFGDRTILRTCQPGADSVSAIIGGKECPMTRVVDDYWSVALPFVDLVDYRYEVTYPDGWVARTADPYRFLPTVGDTDTYLFSEGRHERLWEMLGARPRTYTTADGPVSGVAFSVWAPAARGVAVVGDFNSWNRTQHPMRSLGSSGVWEIFIPDVPVGSAYKFAVHGVDGTVVDKSDPMAYGTEVPPSTASRIVESTYTWEDEEWMADRRRTDALTSPMSVYEVHLGSWRPGLDYRDLAVELVDYVRDMGYTHVELMPVAEHPFGGSWGYQVTSYYAPSSRFGGPDEFRHLVDALHRAGIGVLVDWVPAHFPKDEWALARFDGTPCYEHPDPRRGEHQDWGTLIFDFGRNEVRNFLVANALYWCEEFHIDGLRVDAVASMLYLDYSREDGQWAPNQYGGRENLEAVQFIQEMNATLHRAHPGVLTIAEESTSWPGVTRSTHFGGLGFSMKWNMGWMNDTLRYFSRDPIHRSFHHNDITFSMMYAWSENFVLPISHDEVVHGKGSLWARIPGNAWTKAAGVRALLAYMWAHPGKHLLFMGQDFGQVSEWSEKDGVTWGDLDGWEGEYHRGIHSLTRDLNRVYRENPAFWTQDHVHHGFEWIDANDAQNSVLSFLRWGSDGSVVACLYNLSGVELSGYRVGLPRAGRWTEILNTDATAYEGAGCGNLGGADTEDVSWHGRTQSAVLVLPAHSAVWLRFEN